MSDIPNDLAVASEFAVQDLPPAPVTVEAVKVEQSNASNVINPVKIEEASSSTQDANTDPVSDISPKCKHIKITHQYKFIDASRRYP
jgi:hypothetical protein